MQQAPAEALLDLRATIKALRAELETINRTIAVLEAVLENGGADELAAQPRGKRGRKSMNPEQRQEVSERMMRYWAKRREQKKKGS